MIQSLAKSLLSILLLVAAASVAAKPLPAGSAQSAVIRFQFAVYYPSQPATEPLAALRSAARGWPKLAIVTGPLPAAPGAMLMSARIESDVKKNYAPPDPDTLKHYGRGLSAAQVAALQGAKQALIVDFTHPKQYTAQALRNATALAEQVAISTGGLLWDEETRELFTPERWREKRLVNWAGGMPDVATQITIHAYKKGNLVRAVSLGMSKFGLPDLAVDQFPWSSNAAMGSVINLLAQALAEGAAVNAGGQLDVDLRKIAHKKVQERHAQGRHENANGVVKLVLTSVAPEKGDPANRIAAVGFARYPGPDGTARQNAALTDLYGSSDGIKYITHNDELETASALAHKKLVGMQAEFQRGLRPGEYILVKAPFPTPKGGSEWMWVEMEKWDGERIDGILQNDPYDIPTLRAGQSVRIKLSEVFDYIRVHPGGRREGNTTALIIEKMQGKTKK